MPAAAPDDLLDMATRAMLGDDLSARLAAAARRYVAQGGRMALERCLELPQSPGRRRKSIRNAWLVVALRELRVVDPMAGARALHDALSRFLSRGMWSRWRELEAAPADASRLHRALHAAVRANDGRGLCLKHLAAVLEENSARNFHAGAPE